MFKFNQQIFKNLLKVNVAEIKATSQTCISVQESEKVEATESFLKFVKDIKL